MVRKVLISLPDKFLDDIDSIASHESRSRSELIREALRQYMQNKKHQNADLVKLLLGDIR